VLLSKVSSHDINNYLTKLNELDGVNTAKVIDRKRVNKANPSVAIYRSVVRPVRGQSVRAVLQALKGYIALTGSTSLTCSLISNK
jgi:hypothetical protein